MAEALVISGREHARGAAGQQLGTDLARRWIHGRPELSAGHPHPLLPAAQLPGAGGSLGDTSRATCGSHVWMKHPGSSGVELVPGLLRKPNPCPQGEASLQGLQKAPSPHGPGTQWHGAAGGAGNCVPLCSSGASRKVLTPGSQWELGHLPCDDSHGLGFACFHSSSATGARLDGCCSKPPAGTVLGSKRQAGTGLQAAWVSVPAPMQRLTHLCPESKLVFLLHEPHELKGACCWGHGGDFSPSSDARVCLGERLPLENKAEDPGLPQ